MLVCLNRCQCAEVIFLNRFWRFSTLAIIINRVLLAQLLTSTWNQCFLPCKRCRVGFGAAAAVSRCLSGFPARCWKSCDRSLAEHQAAFSSASLCQVRGCNETADVSQSGRRSSWDWQRETNVVNCGLKEQCDSLEETFQLWYCGLF